MQLLLFSRIVVPMAIIEAIQKPYYQQALFIIIWLLFEKSGINRTNLDNEQLKPLEAERDVARPIKDICCSILYLINISTC